MQRSEHNKFKEKLTIKLARDRAASDQDIHIRDILVYREAKTTGKEYQFSFGERYHPSARYVRLDPYKRLKDHIKVIADVAARIHEHYYCQLTSPDTYEIKEGCRNKITRIVLNEFALYTEKPLTLAQFNELAGYVENVAKNHHENIHWLLSSIAVVTKDQKILNICLYVQCGLNPVVNTLSKAQPNKDDPTFLNTELFRQKQYSAKGASSQFTAMEKNGVIANNGILEIATLGGARYLQVIDICLDYRLGHSKKILSTLLAMATSRRTGCLPMQADHLVTANSVFLSDENNISTTATLVDPVRSEDFMSKPIADDKFLMEIKMDFGLEYKDTGLNKCPWTGALYFMNPPFGDHCKINIQPEKKLGQFKKPFLDKVVKYNLEVEEEFVKIKLDQKKFSNCLHELKALDEMILRICSVTPMESKLCTSSYRLKCQILDLHAVFNKKISLLAEEPSIFLKKGGNLLKEFSDNLERLYNRQRFPHPIKNFLNHKIDYLIEEVFQTSESTHQFCIVC